MIAVRGGVEDTRLEAKAKNIKKIRGQRQPFRGQTLSRPRTDPLKAKDRNARGQGQGPRTQAQVYSEKMSLKKFFRRSTKFQQFKKSAILEPRTGQFSRTWGLEAKAKDFKMCSQGRLRGQGRPRGLHLWLLYTYFWATLYVCPFVVYISGTL